MITPTDLKEIVENLAGIAKNKETIEFIIDSNTIKFRNGMMIRGEYYNESKTIILYSSLIKDKNDLKEIILHEIGHHLGLSHEQIRH